MDETPTPAATSQRIAVIEDDMAIAEMYSIKFENDGYQVATASNGITGLELIRTYKPDIILLDLMMPVMTGQELLRKLSETPEGQAARVIVLTNMGDETTATQVQQYHPVDYIVKANMTPKEVSKRVTELINQAPTPTPPPVA